MLDFAEIIERQLALNDRGAQAEERFVLKDGKGTQLVGVRYVPRADDPAAMVALEGAWRVRRWPFDQPEEALAGTGVVDWQWEQVHQPGKVFTQDPNKPVSEIEKYDRVTLAHLDPEDGAVMRRRVRIPSAWEGRRIFLRFDAIYPAGRIYLDGKMLGEHLSGLTPVEFDVTGLARPGAEVVVAVRLFRRHRFVQMDMPRHASEFAGLAQGARFFSLPQCHIERHFIAAEVDESLAKGRLAGPVELVNRGRRPWKGQVELSILEESGAVIGSASEPVDLQSGAQRRFELGVAVARPKLWNDEFPHLYTARLELKHPEARQSSRISWKAGFRRFSLAGGRPTLNGHPVKFRGVNHLTYHPEHGLHTPRPWLRQCLELMKRANVNCVRTHYLGPPELAELCDELGLYLVQELPIDWGTNYIHDFEWVGPALMRLAGGIVRDRLHPSVMVWSVGNENMPESARVAEDGWNHLRLYDRFVKHLDPTRPTMFPPPGPANKIKGIFEIRVGDIGDTHYSFKLAKEFLATGRVTNPRDWEATMQTTTREQALEGGWSGVWFSSEYGIQNCMPDLLNAPYTSIISDTPEEPLGGKNSLQVFIDRLREEWGFMRDEPSCLGGAYFPWICGAAGDNPWGWVLWAEDNDWGPVTADLHPKPFFWGMRVLFSPLWLPQRIQWQPGQMSVSFEVHNQYNSIDLSQCILRTLMGWGMNPPAGKWHDIPMSCPPGRRAKITIPLWNKMTLDALAKGLNSVVRCHLIDPHGFRPITHDILLIPAKQESEQVTPLAIGPDAVEKG